MPNEHRNGVAGGGAAPLDSTGDKNTGAGENEIEHPSKPGFRTGPKGSDIFFFGCFEKGEEKNVDS